MNSAPGLFVSRFLAFIAAVFLLAGLVLSLRNAGPEAPSRQAQAPAINVPSPAPPGAVSPDGSPSAVPTADTLQALPIPAQTSWQNPFDARLWSADGWSITESGLKVLAGHRTPAVFARPYRQLMLELTAQWPGEVDHREASLLDVQFITDTPDETLSVEMTSEAVSVRRFLNGQPRLIRSARFTSEPGNPEVEPSAETPVRLRLTLTANRLLIQRDNRAVLNLDRPAPPVTKPARVAIVPGTAGLHVIEMRLEGE